MSEEEKKHELHFPLIWMTDTATCFFLSKICHIFMFKSIYPMSNVKKLPDMIYHPKLEIEYYSYHCKYYYLLHVFHPVPTPIPTLNMILVCSFLMYLKLCHDFFVAVYCFAQLIHSFLLVLNWLYVVVFIPLSHIFKTLFLKAIYSILCPLIILIILYF